jgi:hypothetical protein
MYKASLFGFLGAAIPCWLGRLVGGKRSCRRSRRRYAVPPTLWYENHKGEKWVPLDAKGPQRLAKPPAEFRFQHSQFPWDLEHVCCVPGEGKLFSGHSIWPEDLVLAMAHDGYRLGEAILVAANMCGRCRNAAENDYRLGGYPRYSKKWREANTVCDFCRGDRT